MSAERRSLMPDLVHMWLWWATFEIRRASGSNTVAAFKAAQTACMKLHA